MAQEIDDPLHDPAQQYSRSVIHLFAKKHHEDRLYRFVNEIENMKK
jgi:hypothetical protein